MRVTRRILLQLPLLVIVAGCAPSPVILGSPGEVPEPAIPTRSNEAEAVAAWVEGFARLVDELALTPTAWGADEAHTAWITALQQQASAHVARLVADDPVIGGPTAFPTTERSAASATLPLTPDEALDVIQEEVASGADILRDGFTAASTGQDRLLHSSLIVAVAASLTPSLPPVEGGAAPAPFDDPAVADSLVVALGHVRALIRGLEMGLGRLAASDDLAVAGRERLDAARSLRNGLIASLADALPEVDTWELPNAMSTPPDILAAWAILEHNVLDAFGTLTAADASRPDTWLEAMLGQVPWVHRWGGRLPYWPGWVATA